MCVRTRLFVHRFIWWSCVDVLILRRRHVAEKWRLEPDVWQAFMAGLILYDVGIDFLMLACDWFARLYFTLCFTSTIFTCYRFELNLTSLSYITLSYL